jgi:hypothetical protein
VLSDLQITASDYPFAIFKLEKGQEKFEDAKGVIRSRNLKASKHNNQKKKDKKSLKMPKGLSETVI